MMRTPSKRAVWLLLIGLLCLASVFFGITVGSIRLSFGEILSALFIDDDSPARLFVFHLRLPRILCGGAVGICLALSGCILQGLMGSRLASPSTVGVSAGASFAGYLFLAAFPGLSHLLPIGTVIGALFSTLLITLLASGNSLSRHRLILSGLAVSALFSAMSDILKTLFSDRLANVASFLVGGLNGALWNTFWGILPAALIGIAACFLLGAPMNLLSLGDDCARSLGLRTGPFRLLLILLASMLAGSAIAAGGMIGFVGLIVPHIARICVGGDNRILLPASALLGFSLVTICDTLGRILLPVGEIPVSILLSLIGAPFFLWLIRRSDKEGGL